MKALGYITYTEPAFHVLQRITGGKSGMNGTPGGTQMPPMPTAFSGSGFVCCQGTGGRFRLQDPPGSTRANLIATTQSAADNLAGWVDNGMRVTISGMIVPGTGGGVGAAGAPDVLVASVPAPPSRPAAMMEAPVMRAMPPEEAIPTNPPRLITGMRVRLRGLLNIAAIELGRLILILDDGTGRRVPLTFNCNQVRSMLTQIGTTGTGQFAMALPVAVDGVVRSGGSLCVDTIRRFAMMGVVPALGQPLRCQQLCVARPTPAQLRSEMARELQGATMGLIQSLLGARRRPSR